jgi:hypothetical protein
MKVRWNCPRTLWRSFITVAVAWASVSGGSERAPAAVITLQNATATFSQPGNGGPPGYLIGQAIDGIFSTDQSFNGGEGWAIGDVTLGGDITLPQTAVFETAVDLNFASSVLTFSLFSGGDYGFGAPYSHIGNFRLSVTTSDRSTFADGLSSGGDVDTTWHILSPTLATSTGPTLFSILGDQSILATGPGDLFETYTVTSTTNLSGITGIRLEVLAHASLPTEGPGRMSLGNFILREFSVDVVENPAVPEPASIAIWALGAVGAAVIARRQKDGRRDECLKEGLR